MSSLKLKNFEILIDFQAPSLIYIDKITLDINDIVFSLEGCTTLYIGTLKYDQFITSFSFSHNVDHKNESIMSIHSEA